MCAIFDTTVEIFGDAEFEYQIQRAFSESVEKQSCLPLVKQELQCKIQFDRLSRGEPELVLEQEPAKVYELTDEEKRKRDVRLQQNRQSAVRSRQRLKKKEEQLKKRVDSLYMEQKQLTKTFRDLAKEKTMTVAKLKAHLGVCGDKKKRNQLSYDLLLH